MRLIKVECDWNAQDENGLVRVGYGADKDLDFESLIGKKVRLTDGEASDVGVIVGKINGVWRASWSGSVKR